MTKNKKLMIIFSVVVAFALLIILNSVLFSVQYVNAACWNDNDLELDDAIEMHHGIRYGSSIFVLDEQKTAETMRKNLAENGVPNVEILSLERKIPNRVVVHYIKIVDYFYVLQDGQAYYFSNKNATLTAIKPANISTGNTIQLKIAGTLIHTELGSSFSSTVAGEKERVDALLSSLERTEGLPFSNLRNYFSFADIAGKNIYIETARGVHFEFRSLENFQAQFQSGLSAYIAYRDNDVLKALSGTIILNANTPTTWTYTQEIFYQP